MWVNRGERDKIRLKQLSLISLHANSNQRLRFVVFLFFFLFKNETKWNKVTSNCIGFKIHFHTFQVCFTDRQWMRHGELARVWVISKGFCLVDTTPGVVRSTVHIVYTAGVFMDEEEGLETRYAGLGNRVWSVVGLQPWCSYFLQYFWCVATTTAHRTLIAKATFFLILKRTWNASNI